MWRERSRKPGKELQEPPWNQLGCRGRRRPRIRFSNGGPLRPVDRGRDPMSSGVLSSAPQSGTGHAVTNQGYRDPCTIPRLLRSSQTQPQSTVSGPKQESLGTRDSSGVNHIHHHRPVAPHLHHPPSGGEDTFLLLPSTSESGSGTGRRGDMAGEGRGPRKRGTRVYNERQEGFDGTCVEE